MYFYRKDDCIKCNDCIKNPCDDSCNTACNPKVNCYESYKVFAPDIYAKPYITLQPYEHLFNLTDAFYAGTIFKDLYSPYCAMKYVKGVK
ncbi:MAG: spore coat associated protein CotJA [Clostridium sp.]|nr:spore coat associated protein CotJA [Clostridium sp.]